MHNLLRLKNIKNREVLFHLLTPIFSAGAYHTDDYLFTVFSGSNTIIETGSVFCMFKMAHIKSAFAGKYKFFSEGRWQEKLPKGAPFKCGKLLDILNEMIGLFQILDFKLASIVFDCKCSGNDPGWTYYQANLYQMMAEVVKSEQVLYYSKEQLQQLTVSTTKVSYYISVTQSHTYLQSVQGLYYG